MPYSKRWDLLQKVVRPLIYDSHPMCDISVKYPDWKSLKAFGLETDEVGYSYEFQPEAAGQKRLLWLLPKANDTFKAANFHEREMISYTSCAIIPDIDDSVKPTPIIPKKEVVVKGPSKGVLTGFLVRDKLSKLPDTYKLTTEGGEDLGLAAIRSMEMSSKLRKVGSEGCRVELQWYESFQKYEVRRIL
jgi:hypothetical protein